MSRTSVIGTIREFKTAQFRVVVDAIEEDSPDLSWDETGETIEGLRSGKYMIFCARVRVIHKRFGELSSDYLGNTIHESLEQFADHIECGRYNRELAAKGDTARCGSYFKDMVHSAIDQARKEVAKRITDVQSLKRMKLRASVGR